MEYVMNMAGGSVLSRAARSWKMGSLNARKGLPLLLASPLSPDDEETGPVERVVDVMSDAGAQLLEHLHHVTKHLEFWQDVNEGGENDKLSFMILERGPWAFIQGVTKFIQSSFVEASPAQDLVVAAGSRISERVAVLVDLRERLATMTGQVHMEVDKMGEKVSDGEKGRLVASECMVAVLQALSVLEGAYQLPQSDYYNHGDVSSAVTLILEFNKIPDVLVQQMEWTDNEFNDALRVLDDNLWKLHNFLDTMMWQYKRPRKVVRKWILYSGVALGLGILSGWLFRHSRLSGSNDLDQWFKESVDATAGFLDEHVQQPLLSIRDDLFETFHKRHREVNELGDVKLTAESLHRMLREFVVQTKGSDLAKDSSEQQLMELMMSRYEQELTHPLRNLVGGELARALLIQIDIWEFNVPDKAKANTLLYDQVQKLKLDIETAMLELNQILRANEINFAVLAALPALLVAILLGWLLKWPFTQGKGAEGNGRRAQLQRRMLMVEVENAIMTCQMAVDEGQEEAVAHFGTLIYRLDRLFKLVRKPATESGEWSSLQKDIVELAKPRLSTYYKLAIAARMERVYDCLAPMPKLT